MTAAAERNAAGRAPLWLLVVVAAAAWPIANFLHNNWSQLVAGDFIRALAWWAGVSAGVSLLVLMASRIARRVTLAQFALAASVGLVLSFWFEWSIKRLVVSVTALGLSGRVAIVAYLAAAGLAALAVLLVARASAGRRVVATFIAVGAGMSLAQLAHDVATTDSSERAVAAVPPASFATALERRPNVMFVIVDGYSRADVLARMAALDNRAAIDALRERGFTVLEKSVANYPVTYLSVSSMLAGDYVALPETPYSTRWRFYDIIQGNNPLVATLRAGGYAYVHSGNAWGGSSCGGREDFCLNSQESFSASEFDLGMLKMTPLRLLLPEVVASTARGNLEFVLRHIDIVYRRQPVFLFAHTMPPHPPFEWNADCSRKKREANLEAWSEQAEYRDNVLCVNKQLLQFADTVARRDPEAIIVFVSDHGSSFKQPFKVGLQEWSDEMVFERFPTFVAVKAPRDCGKWLKPNLSNVNIARFILACVSGRAPDYLPDRFFTGAHEGHPGFGRLHEVTGRVQSLELR